MSGARPSWGDRAVAAATAGVLHGLPWTADGVAIDTRSLQPGDLFVALHGPNRDGHAFLADAAAKGAAAALVDRELAAAPLPLIRVADTQRGLEDLGRAGRRRSAARVVAITGSVGKTGTKEALRHVLAGFGPTHASAKSHNNQWGVPLTLALLPEDSAFAVIEIGMNHAGEIRSLAPQARPHVAMITRIAPAHLGNFDSVEGIARAKGEIFEGLEPDGCAVLNRDDPYFDLLASLASDQRARRIITFGERADADIRLAQVTQDATCSDIVADVLGRPVSYRIGAPGRHLVQNSLGWLAVLAALDLDVAVGAERLRGHGAPVGRGARHEIAAGTGKALLIDEGYNANPASLRAALEVLAMQAGRRVAVLGDMLELGEDSPRLHAEIAAHVLAAGVERVVACGPLMRHLIDALPASLVAGWANDSAGLLPQVEATLQDGDVVLVKGSLGSRMAVITDALVARPVAAEA